MTGLLGMMTDHLPPQWLTFTGLDQRTDLQWAGHISARYPVEWGVLFSPRLSGQHPRYPGANTVDSIRSNLDDCRLAAHLCGDYARRALCAPDRSLLALVEGFQRVQLNFAPTPNLHGKVRDPQGTGMPFGHWEAGRFADYIGRPVIVQTRSARAWPDTSGYGSVDKEYLRWLYDLSGGKGKAPARWPAHPGGDLCVGYAGGISPDNVLEVIGAIASTGPYWLDMEGNVRDQNDWLALDKVESVCSKVYAQPA